jgi:transcription-repair coupling factor (superfamily II helicase)
MSKEIIYKVAHGQIHNIVLDNVMNDFYDGQFNVLISTSIVENGLDIPDVNTIIVYRANMFGLSQLHQLRGRVGRGKIKGYAYFFINPTDNISENAIKRLKAIENNQEIGSGFAIANNDMDIRGSGNLVGEEQSGHMKEVGIELYNQMLVEEINKIKNNFKGEHYDWMPQIKLNLSTSIGTYIVDQKQRLHYYREIATKRENIIKELETRYGKVPQEVYNLIEISKIKNECHENMILKLEYNETLNINFYEDRYKNPEFLFSLIKKGEAKMINQNTIGFFIKKEYFFQEIHNILKRLKDII